MIRSFVLSMFLAAFSQGVAAQGGDEARAREVFRRGVEALRAEDWERARELFEEAYELAPRTSILTNLATAQAQSGRLIEARTSYETLLEDPPNRRAARRLRESLEVLESRIPTITVRPQGAQVNDDVVIDGAFVSADEAVPVNPGWREVEVQRNGDTVATLRVRVHEGDQEEVEIIVRAPSPRETAERLPVGTSPIQVPEEGEEADEEEADEDGSKTWLWITLAVVGAAAAGGITAAVLLSGDEGPFVGNAIPGTATVR